MKIIDERGMLFGKVNIIDFIVVLFLLCLTPMVYFGYKIMQKEPQALKQANPYVEITKKEYNELKNPAWEIVAYYELKSKVDTFLTEHKRAVKHF